VCHACRAWLASHPPIRMRGDWPMTVSSRVRAYLWPFDGDERVEYAATEPSGGSHTATRLVEVFKREDAQAFAAGGWPCSFVDF
jgi:hypothetical protein